MPSERRNLRSSKETSSSTNGDNARSNSQSSSAKDKPVPTRSTSSKTKAAASKKATGSDKSGNPPTNGSEPVENGVNGTDDMDMEDNDHGPVNADKEPDEEMTVVVPPLKGSKLSGEQGKDSQGGIAMESLGQPESGTKETEEVDPKVKAATGILARPVLPYDQKIPPCRNILTL